MEEKIYKVAKGLFNVGYSKDMVKCIDCAMEGLIKSNQITAKDICNLAICYGVSKKDLKNIIYEKYAKDGVIK